MAKTDFTLIQITDTHLLADPAGRQAGWNTQASLDAVLADVRAHYRPDALLVTGDLVHDELPDGYRRLAQQLQVFGVPVLVLPGNHDHPDLLATNMTVEGVQVLGEASFNGWRILLLNDHLRGEDGGHLPPAELQRLEEWLASDNAPALVALHHPPVLVGSRWLDGSRLDNGDELLSHLRHFPQLRALVCGHIHQELDTQSHGLRVLGAPSTCRQFLPASDEFAVDDRPPGYRVFLLGLDGSYFTQVHRVPAALAAGYQTPT